MKKYLNKIIQGDCLEVMKEFSNESIDLIVTDPPYNIKYNYKNYKDNLLEEEYFDWQLSILKQFERILKRNGSLFYLNYPEFNSKIYCALMGYSYLKPIEIIAWVYNSHNSGILLRKAFRTWIWASKGEPINNFKGEYKNITDKRVLELIKENRKPKEYDWWNIEQVKNISKEKTSHPCQLPIRMIKKIIQGTSNENDIILDPFLGSGTTCVAAKNLNRKYIGIEIDKEYCKIAEKRLRQNVLL